MIKVVEAFSGIGSQAKALKRIKQSEYFGKNFEYEIVNTIEWDISAILAYDLIHNDGTINSNLEKYSKEELIGMLSKYPLSIDGSGLVNPKYFNRFDEISLIRFLTAIKRTNNLISIKNVDAEDLADDIDIFTYSFPCQDLSLSGYFHGDTGGISRDAENSSSMLWEVERILRDFIAKNKTMPKLLIMENVTSITSNKHIHNFNEWISSLEEMNYVSKYFELQALNFGLPQSRRRTFMISVHHGGNENLREQILETFRLSSLNLYENGERINELRDLQSFLKTDYKNEVYRLEAINQVPNDTPSRKDIFEKNPKITNSQGKAQLDHIRTITTRQDRHPNSGVILIDKNELGLDKNKSNFRYLSPRETFLLMGFDESDFEKIINNNLSYSGSRNFFSDHKLLKLAGNSIVVDVMEEVMKESIIILLNLGLV